MDTKVELSALKDRVVYVKSVQVKDLPEDIQEQAGEVETIFSVDSSEGARLALVANRDLAFVLAKEHDLKPVAVH